MKISALIAAIGLLIPAAAVAQSLDLTEDPGELGSELHPATGGAPDAKDLEAQVESTPSLIEPKFDLTPEPDEPGAAGNLRQTEPDPAPGLVIKIPTN